MNPPERILPLRFDDRGNFLLGPPRHMSWVSNQEIRLVLTLEKMVSGSVPPSFEPIDVTGSLTQWVMKLSIDDAVPQWDITGVIIGPASEGRIRFEVPRSSVPRQVLHAYSEFILRSGGVKPDLRVPMTLSITKPVIEI